MLIPVTLKFSLFSLSHKPLTFVCTHGIKMCTNTLRFNFLNLLNGNNALRIASLTMKYPRRYPHKTVFFTNKSYDHTAIRFTLITGREEEKAPLYKYIYIYMKKRETNTGSRTKWVTLGSDFIRWPRTDYKGLCIQVGVRGRANEPSLGAISYTDRRISRISAEK